MVVSTRKYLYFDSNIRKRCARKCSYCRRIPKIVRNPILYKKKRRDKQCMFCRKL